MRTSARVVLSLSANRSYDRGCLRGIARFLRIHGPWDVIHVEPGWFDAAATGPVQGVITSLDEPELAIRFSGTSKPPVVDVGGDLCARALGDRAPDTASPTATVQIDPAAVARAGADYFLERGFRHFAYCSQPGSERSELCRDAFTRYLAARGHSVTGFGRVEENGGEHLAAMSAWLKPLPRPLAVLSCDDKRGRQLIQACNCADIAVPAEVSILGIGDEEIICELTEPPLSSIRLNTEEIGFRAAALLAEMMQGRPGPFGPVLVPPAGVAARASSDLPAIDDPVVARAVHVIRAEACNGLNVEELLQHLTVSRATLERRFARARKQSPKDEILRLRLDRAKQLLRETDYNLAAIATLCGFKTAAHLSVTFKSDTGKSPGQFRTG